MAQVIDITSEINKRRLKKVKAELELELQRLDFSIDEEINKYVIFDTSNYYELLHEGSKEVVSYDKVTNLLLTAFDMLVKLNNENAAIDLENIITRIENNSY